MAGNAGLAYVKDASEDAQFCVPTTLNTIGIDEQDWREIGFPEEFSLKQLELSAAYRKMGAIPLNTCTPFLCGSLPRFGEHVAWGESSAICFVNSVLGARTNREGGPSALAAAITGRVPKYGFHLDENRKATYLVKVEKEPKTDKDFAVLGYSVGRQVGTEVPVFDGFTRLPSIENYKALCAALASSGAVALFHIAGYTPEAPTVDAVLADGAEKPCVFDQAAYDKVTEKFSYTGSGGLCGAGLPACLDTGAAGNCGATGGQDAEKRPVGVRIPAGEAAGRPDGLYQNHYRCGRRDHLRYLPGALLYAA